MSEVVELSDGAWTPEYTLRRALADADQFQDVAIVTRHKDGKLGVLTSQLRFGTLTMLAARLQYSVTNWFNQKKEAGI